MTLDSGNGRGASAAPPEKLPTDLAERLAELDEDELRAVVAYARSLTPAPPSAADLITEGPGEEILEVEEESGYAKVVKRQSCAEGCDECPHGPYLFHVRVEERPLDGEPNLHWEYLGPVNP